MPVERILLCLAGVIAALGLVKLMQHRQNQLRALLSSYVERQSKWARKRAKAAAAAQRAAVEKGPDPDLLPFSARQIADNLPTENGQESGSPIPEKMVAGR